MQHSGPPALGWHLLGPKAARFFNARIQRKYSRGNLRNLTAKRMRERKTLRFPRQRLYAKGSFTVADVRVVTRSNGIAYEWGRVFLSLSSS